MKWVFAFLCLLFVGTSAGVRAEKGRGFQNDIIYSVLVDRFDNGNRGNDVPLWAFASESAADRANRYWVRKMSQPRSEHGETPLAIQKYWGGDLRGLISKLGYLHDLGVTIVMVSPVFENVNGYNYELGGTAYHGYWTKDFKRLEEHFVDPPAHGESSERLLAEGRILRELVQKAHALKPPMKVVLDIPLNHTSPAPIGTTVRDANNFLELGALYDEGRWLTQACDLAEGKSCGETYSRSGWFHFPPIWVEWDRPETLYRGNINGNLADLDQRQPFVRDYLLGALRKWLSFGVDGFRLDAAKNIYPEFLHEVESELSALRPDVLLLGEYFDGGLYSGDLRPNKNASVSWLGQFDRMTMFDFSFAHALRNYFRRNWSGLGTERSLEVILDETDKSNFFGDRTLDLVIFVNNHDVPRMLSLPGATRSRFEAALELMLLSHGVPNLMYGDEIGLAIPADHPHWQRYSRDNAEWSRLPMDWSATSGNSTYALVKHLIELRKRNDFLRFGPTRFLKAMNLWNWLQGNTYLAMLREDPVPRSTRKLFFVYTHDARRELLFEVPFADGSYVDPLSGKAYPVNHGRLSLRDLAAGERVVLLAK